MVATGTRTGVGLQGAHVRYIRTTFVPGEERCMCLFEAPSVERVKEANETAGLPFKRIVEALDLTPKSTSAGA